IRYEWTYIPHFYYDDYVYQYATSFTASQALAEQILAGDEEVRDRYLHFLSSGASAYPVDLLRKAGVDMTEEGPFRLTIEKINRVMDEMEELIHSLRTCLALLKTGNYYLFQLLLFLLKKSNQKSSPLQRRFSSRTGFSKK